LDYAPVVILLITATLCLAGIVAYNPPLREMLWQLSGKKPIIEPNRKWPSILKLNSQTATLGQVTQQHKVLLSKVRSESHFKHGDRVRLSSYVSQAQASIQERDLLALKELKLQQEREHDALTRKARFQQQNPQLGLTLTTANSWRMALGLPLNEMDLVVIKKAYRKCASRSHPDKGGAHNEMARINEAYAEAQTELNFS